MITQAKVISGMTKYVTARCLVLLSTFLNHSYNKNDFHQLYHKALTVLCYRTHIIFTVVYWLLMITYLPKYTVHT